MTVAIVGTGREGVSAARMLKKRGDVSLMAIIDAESGPGKAWGTEFGESIPVHVVAGGDPLPGGIDVAIMSPGVAPHRPLFHHLVAAGVVMTSGTDMFVNTLGARMVGVTGSKGKSTTSALIAHLLAAHGVDVSWGGNVGIPLWDLEPADVVVAEFSSYQCSSLTASPLVAVVTSLFEEHLDWHGSAEQYFSDKLRLLAHKPHATVLGGQSQTLLEQVAQRYPGHESTVVGQNSAWSVEEVDGLWQVTTNSHAVIACRDLPLLGRHNWWNVAIASQAAAEVVDLDHRIVADALTRFRPLPHRLEPIIDSSGVVFVNDSLATNPSAAAMALGAMRERRVFVLLGGADRGVDKTPLQQEIVAHPPRAIIGLPASGPDLIDDIHRWCEESGVAPPECVAASGMDEALSWARARAVAGDVVLMSPGAPSFGEYRDYEHRAEDFRRAIVDSQPS